MPDSVDIPAPVKTTARRAAAIVPARRSISARASSISAVLRGSRFSLSHRAIVGHALKEVHLGEFVKSSINFGMDWPLAGHIICW